MNDTESAQTQASGDEQKQATFDELDATLGDLCSWAERATSSDEELAEVTGLYAKVATLARRLHDA